LERSLPQLDEGIGTQALASASDRHVLRIFTPSRGDQTSAR